MTSYKNQAGFAASIVIACCITLLLLGYIGYRFFSTSSEPSAQKTLMNTPTQATTDTAKQSIASDKAETADSAISDPPAPSTPASTPSIPSPSPQPSSSSPTISLIYKILSDGTAQLMPASTTVSSNGVINIALNLSCASTCQFKLASDRYTFSNTTIYDSSQKISYTLDGKGNFLLYNELNPSIKFKLTIN